MEVTQGEGLCHIKLLLKDIGGLTYRNPPRNLLKSATNASDMPQIFISQEEPSIPFPIHDLLHSGDWTLSGHSPKQLGIIYGLLPKLIISPNGSK